MFLLFMGVNMQAQSVAAEQMDERFNNGTNLPYGWFTEGWTVKDGAIQTASSGFNFDLGSLFGGKPESEKTEDPENTENPEGTEGNEGTEDPEGTGNSDPEGTGDPENTQPGGGTPDISSLLESLMGGGSKDNYLLTPPLVVNDGEKLVFSAKKGKKDDSGSGMSLSFGSSDSTFVIERSEYSKNQWVRVADFTTELDTIYKTFTISNTPAGEYRFRFKAGGTVLIDSVAGMHIDSKAPDLYIIENDARAYHFDLGHCTEDSTRTFQVINTATGTLNVGIVSDNAALFSVTPGELAVEAADTTDVSITFNFASGQPGKNEAGITFTPTDTRVYGKTLRATAVVTQPGVWMEDFNANVQPKGFFTEGWEFHDQVATTSSGGGMGAMFGGGGSSASFLMTPPLKVESIDDVLLFSARKGSSDGGFDMSSMFGGGSSSIVVEKSVYGSGKWEKVKEFTEPLDSTYRTLWVGYVEPGEYRFRIIASDSIVIDSIAGFHLDENAPDIYVLRNNTAATGVNYGMPQANSTETFAVVNTGTGSLQGTVASTNGKDFALSANSFDIHASDTAFVSVTYVFDPESLGIHQGAVTFAPTTGVLAPLSYPLTAYSTYADAWTEDFEPEFLPEDETRPIPLPDGWTTTGWEVSMPSSSGGLMDMLGGLMGGGGDAAPKTYMANTSSDAYELITPRLQAKKGDVLRFYAELGGGGLMDMLGMFMGGAGGSGQLNVWYSRDNEGDWTYYDTFTQNGYAYFVAPYSGVYQLRFTSPGASIDNFYGLHLYAKNTIEEMALTDDAPYINDIETACDKITYTRNFTHTKWQALYVPFEVAYDDWSADFEVARLNDVHQWDDDEDGSIDRTELEIVKMKSGKTEANTPYLIRALEEGEKTLTVTNATLHRADENSIDCSSVATLFTFTGTYAGIDGPTMFNEGYYAIGNGSLVQAESSANNLLPYRWYLNVTDRNGNPKNIGEVKLVVFGNDGDTDGIEDVEIGENESDVYDLSGRCIVSPRSGMYVRNGKKYLVK